MMSGLFIAGTAKALLSAFGLSSGTRDAPSDSVTTITGADAAIKSLEEGENNYLVPIGKN